MPASLVTEISPEVWVSTPEMMLSRVLLPQPDGPTMETNVCPRTSKEMWSSTRLARGGARAEGLAEVVHRQDGHVIASRCESWEDVPMCGGGGAAPPCGAAPISVLDAQWPLSRQRNARRAARSKTSWSMTTITTTNRITQAAKPANWFASYQ